VDATADADIRFNNSHLARLGEDILGYYCSEHLICHYPRLPVEVLWEAQRAYIGPDALAALAREWGVDAVEVPGGEVDPGLLQFKKQIKTNPHFERGYMGAKKIADREALLPELLRQQKQQTTTRNWGTPRQAPGNWQITNDRHRITNSYRIMNGDTFGNDASAPDTTTSTTTTTIGTASMNFVRAVIAGIQLHTGPDSARTFFHQHILSRSLNLSSLFAFERPHRDLILLCNREGFEPPVARVISRTGQLSANAVFVVGIFSGRDKIGEGVGSSLAEAKVRATVAALKAWYLYSPLDVTCPSETETAEGQGQGKWKPNLVDWDEVVV
jgi:dsRNA-specific ribonuclease